MKLDGGGEGRGGIEGWWDGCLVRGAEVGCSRTSEMERRRFLVGFLRGRMGRGREGGDAAGRLEGRGGLASVAEEGLTSHRDDIAGEGADRAGGGSR